MTTISCRDLAFSSFTELCVATKFLCHNTVYVASHFYPRRDNFFWSPSVCVATTILCRDLTVCPFTEFCVMTTIPCHDTISIVSQFDPWSQPPFHVATSFLVFCLHASCDSNCQSVYFLVETWELDHNKVVSFLTAIPITTSKACRKRSFFQSCRNLIF